MLLCRPTAGCGRSTSSMPGTACRISARSFHGTPATPGCRRSAICISTSRRNRGQLSQSLTQKQQEGVISSGRAPPCRLDGRNRRLGELDVATGTRRDDVPDFERDISRSSRADAAGHLTSPASSADAAATVARPSPADDAKRIDDVEGKQRDMRRSSAHCSRCRTRIRRLAGIRPLLISRSSTSPSSWNRDSIADIAAVVAEQRQALAPLFGSVHSGLGHRDARHGQQEARIDAIVLTLMYLPSACR